MSRKKVNWNQVFILMMIPVIVNMLFYFFVDHYILNKATIGIIFASFIYFICVRIADGKDLDPIIIFLANALNIVAYLVYLLVF